MVHTTAVSCLDFSADSQLLVSGDLAGTIQVWKVQNGKCLRKFDVQLSRELAAVTTVLINPQNSKIFAAYPQDRSVRIFGLKSGSMLK